MTEWRNFLHEGKYEAATTELTRKVIPHVKYIIDEVIPSDNVQNSRKDLILVIGKKYETGKGLPKELEKEMYMAQFTFHIDKKLAEETGDKFQIGGMHMSDPYDRRDDYIKINSYFDIGFNEQDLNEYLGELYLNTNRRDKAVERLNILKSCNCKEYTELKEIIDGKRVSKY